MSDWPNDMTKVTGSQVPIPWAREVFGAIDMFNLEADYLKWCETNIHMLYPDPVTFGDAAVPLAHSVDGAIDMVGLSDAANEYHGAQDGVILTLDRTGAAWHGFADAQEGLYDCPYPAVALRRYLIGTGPVLYPVPPAIASGGYLRLKTWARGCGLSADPDAVDTATPGQITFDLTNNLFFGGVADGGAWPASLVHGRDVIIWLNNPKVASDDAVWYGKAYSDGAGIYAACPHTFGQATPSATATDYTVVVPGLIIAPDGYDMVGAGLWVLGSVTTGVVTTAEQTLAPMPGWLGTRLTELEQLRTTPERFGAWLGTEAQFEAWNAVAQMTVNEVPDPQTFTFTPGAIAADWIVKSHGHLSATWKVGGDVVTMAKAAALDTYVIYVECNPGSGEDPELELVIDTEVHWIASYLDRLPLYRFDYNPALGDGFRVTNLEYARLYAYRGIFHPGAVGAPGATTDGEELVVQDLILQPPLVEVFGTAEPPRAAIQARRIAGPPERAAVGLYLFGAGVAPTPAAGVRFLDIDQPAATDVIWRLLGSAADGAAPQPLGNGNRLQLQMGNRDAGLALLALGGIASAADVFGIAKADLATPTPPRWLLKQEQDGGNSTDQIAAIGRPLTYFYDAQLIGTYGKLITVGVPIFGQVIQVNGTGALNWAWDTGELIWSIFGVDVGNSTIYVRIPYGGRPGRGPAGVAGGTEGFPCKLSKVTAYLAVANGAADELIRGHVVEVDPTATPVGGPPTYVAKSGATTWATASAGEKDVDITSAADPDGEPTGIAMDPNKEYWLRLVAEPGAGPLGADRRLCYLKATYRVWDFGAGCP